MATVPITSSPAARRKDGGTKFILGLVIGLVVGFAVGYVGGPLIDRSTPVTAGGEGRGTPTPAHERDARDERVPEPSETPAPVDPAEPAPSDTTPGDPAPAEPTDPEEPMPSR